MFKGLSHIMIYSTQHAESVKWYCDKLEFEIDYNAPGAYASLHHKVLGRLAIHATDDKGDCGVGPMPYLLADDIHKTVQKLKDLQIEVGTPRKEGESPLFTQFKDLDGNLWGIEEV